MIDQNLADTLNKALDLAKQGVVAGFEMVKQAAPYVWSLALRQTILEGVEYATFAILLLIVGVIVLPRVWRWGMRYASDSGGVSVFFASCAIVVTVVPFCVCLVNAIDFIGNPGYWTIVKIASMIKH